MGRKLTHEVAHLPGVCIALLLSTQRGAVLETEEHLAHFVLVGVLNQHDVQWISVETDTQLVRQLVVPESGNRVPVDHLRVSRQAVVSSEELPDGTQSLLTISARPDRLTDEDKAAIHTHRDALADLVRYVDQVVA